jgi:hypothetical protein
MGQNQVKEKDPHETTPILMPELSLKEKSKMENEFQLHHEAYLGELEKVRLILKKDDRLGDSIVRKLDTVQMTPLHNTAHGGQTLLIVPL